VLGWGDLVKLSLLINRQELSDRPGFAVGEFVDLFSNVGGGRENPSSILGEKTAI
jgi:hypothetical protein